MLNDYHTGRSSYLSPKEQKELIVELESKVYPTTKSIISYVKEEFGVVYTIGGMTSLLHKLGFSYKKPKGVPGKAKSLHMHLMPPINRRTSGSRGLPFIEW